MRVLLLGYPLEHSLSPRFQNPAFRELGLQVTYAPHPTTEIDVAAMRALLLSDDVLGANVTVPHKRAIIPALDGLTPLAVQLGAVNTVFRQQRPSGPSIVGDNTDVYGLERDLERHLGAARLGCAVVLGAGGAAAAVLAALARRSDRIALINRTRSHAEDLAALLSHLRNGAHPFEVHEVPHPGEEREAADARQSAIHSADVVIDATAIGLGEAPGTAGYRRGLDTLGALRLDTTLRSAFFYDLKYGATTPFQEIAAALGRRHADGLGMLVLQGARSFERWTGRAAPLKVMAQAAGLVL